MRETRKCAICGKEFIPNTYNSKYCSAECKYEAMKVWKRDYYNREQKKPDGIKRGKRGLLYEKKGSVVRIHWTGQMLSDLKRWYATTRNAELAECLGVSLRTLIRKARELGLTKDPDWVRGISKANARTMHAVNKKNGWKGMFKKGNKPKVRFEKGHQMTPEQKEKQKASLRRWAMANPTALRERGRKSWETRRRRAQETL